jgi:CheY-like chemotaxis protein
MNLEFLVVEDDPVMQVLTPRMLHTLGYTCRVTTNGEDAITACREMPPDAVLMDVQMPRMNGLEATRELRRMQREDGLPIFPIIVLSAFHTPAERAACFDAGADGFITKPLMIAKLATEIHRVISQRRQPEAQKSLL